MTPEQEERYTFCKLWNIDFREAMRVARMARECNDEGLKNLLLKDVIVSYSRPFSANRGVLKRTHRLKEEFVPVKHLLSHRELIYFRNAIIAHTDYSARDPQVVNWSGAGGKWFPMSIRNYANEFARLRGDLNGLEKMISEVNEKLQDEIDRMEDQFLLEEKEKSLKGIRDEKPGLSFL